MHTFPKLTALEMQKSQQVTQLLIEKIRSANGCISFADYMQVALYSANGFYQANTPILGSDGHFTTASELSPLYSQCFARQIMEINAAITDGAILEIGAGSGQFAWHLLQALEEKNTLPSHYFILEISQTLAAAQKKLVSTLSTAITERIIWLEKLPSDFAGVIVCNEVLDALPTTCFKINTGKIVERAVAYNGQEFIWQDRPANNTLTKRIKNITAELDLPDNYCSEINLSYEKFIAEVTNCLNRGVILFADYGYGRAEYYHPERMQGTLTCFYQQHRHANPLLYPGLQDITAHVDFTAVAELAINANCDLAGYCTQNAFLLSLGILDIASNLKLDATSERAMHAAIKRLLYPTEMGETVKIMALSKHFNLPLTGFSMQDRSREL